MAINTSTPVMTATVGGTVPTPPNNTTTFLRGDGTFAAPTSSIAQQHHFGDVFSGAGAGRYDATGSTGTGSLNYGVWGLEIISGNSANSHETVSCKTESEYNPIRAGTRFTALMIP